MIEVQGLTKRYGPVEAVRGISFEVAPGEIVGFLGPNGAGKTTTLRILTGFMPASGGIAVVAGHDVQREPLAVKRRVGYLPESVPLYPEMLVRSYLAYVAEIKIARKRERAAEVDRVMERCGLTAMSRRAVGHLSKGYRQRVGLAQALIGNPPVLILDEPTVGLDPKQIVSIRETIRELANDHTVLISTHILPEVSMLCRRAIILNRGRIAAQEDLANLPDGRTLEEVFLAAISSEAEAVA
jgi:ABC-2 type transport system ATP-binding protein